MPESVIIDKSLTKEEKYNILKRKKII